MSASKARDSALMRLAVSITVMGAVIVRVPFRAKSDGLKERQRAQLDAFAGPGVGRAGGVFEGGMGGEAHAGVGVGIEYLEYQCFIRRHLRKIDPFVVFVI